MAARLAARFVSGYLLELKADAPPAAGSPEEPDVAALHAWAEVCIPGAGWIGLDPTSGLYLRREQRKRRNRSRLQLL